MDLAVQVRFDVLNVTNHENFASCPANFDPGAADLLQRTGISRACRARSSWA